ncbi:tetratricopeptide repeat protein [Sphingopyxis granuli]|uniref:tetratricopeptide repeat protein n=1 Tax=Sphingopyxis granuli TaxID=267128 RepID=UPI001BAF0009|nr:tetratricopeptide repeat protein [Sphingopyxis granuli]QUM72317.1 tetratricopeptide repeat protein [Sphingopyxis granuli]
MALSPDNAAFLLEVDEAVRKDRLDTLWRRYGWWIIGAIVAALVAFGGWLYWGHAQQVKRGEQAEALVAAFEKAAASQPNAAAKDLDRIVAEGSPAYRSAALMQQANIKAQAGDRKGAAALMAKVAGDKKIDPALRNAALLRQTALEFDTLKPQAVIDRMKPLVEAKDPASSWFASAAELSAIAYYQLGQYDRAGELYGRIAKLPDVPKSLQSRAVQMAGMLGVDAVADRAGESADKDRKDAAGSQTAATEKTEETK